MNMYRKTMHAGNRKTGFTLVEVMVAAAIGSLVVAGSFTAFIALSRAAAGSVNAAALHSGLRLGIDRVMSDLAGASQISAVYPENYMIFHALTPAGSEMRIFYHDRSGKRFYVFRGGRWRTLVEHVERVTFTLYGDDGQETKTLADAVSVGVRISGTRQWADSIYSDEVFTQMMLRNRIGV